MDCTDQVGILGIGHKQSRPVSDGSQRGGVRKMGKCEKYPSIRKMLWGGALWSPSYFAGSCGGAPISIIRQYIEQQKTPN